MIALVPKRFRSIKAEIRVLGIDDGKFVPHTAGVADVVGVVYRGGYWFEGVMHTAITVDGLDATTNIAEMIKNSPYYPELRVILLDGVTFGGFNVVDISLLSQTVELPVISVTREKPDLDSIKSALKHLPDSDTRWQAIENAGTMFAVQTRVGENPVYVHVAGILPDDAENVLKTASPHSNIPEALRVAHLIASGLTSLIEKI
ncbi:MAG: DUF99 family protein [Candidatus Bathyarchaeia archaeon]